MPLNIILSSIAYCTFLTGAARSFQTGGNRASVGIMLGGIGLDVLLSVLPLLGVTALRSALPVMNTGILTGIVLGGTVWLLFFSALVVRSTARRTLYHLLITACQLLWFIAFIAFLYGMFVLG